MLAYDGFENLAGQLRRDRSGFGWSGGWQTGGRGRGKLSEVIDTPQDVVFGMDRTGRRLLLLSHGDNIRRQFEQPLTLTTGKSYFFSFLMMRSANESDSDKSLQLSLETSIRGPGHRQPPVVSFGITTKGFPFMNSNNAVTETASPISEGDVYLGVVKLSVNDQGLSPFLRVYRSGEQVDTSEPLSWTVTGASSTNNAPLESVRLSAGQNASCHVDELKIGLTWQSVTGFSTFD